MSRSLHVRPADYLGVSNSFERYLIDKLVFVVGTAIESEIEDATRNTKNSTQAAGKAQVVLNRWLRSEGKDRYRDPAR